ncbi:MAG: SRPBCC domain-containing protein [Myxococcaceae bacterium]
MSRVIPANPERIFNAWLSAEEHARIIGSSATAGADGDFTAWDGYISGKTVEQTPHSRIVQTWRTTEFPEGAPDSQLEVLFAEQDGGTLVTLRHTNLPEGQGQSYKDGWSEHYFEPMEKYFGSAGSKLRGAGEAMSDAAEHVAEAGEAVGEVVENAVAEVRKTAKKATKAVKSLVSKARKALARKPKKKAAKKASKAPKKKVKAKAKKPAPKKKKAAGKKKRR